VWILRDLRILPKLLLAFGWLALVSAFLTGWTSYRSAKAALEEATFERLTTIREAKKRQIESSFREIREHVQTLASTPWIVKATEKLAHAFHAWQLEDSQRPTQLARYNAQLRSYYEREFLPKLQRAADRPRTVDEYWPADEQTVLLQYHFIAANPHPTGEKDRLVEVSPDSMYGRIHAEIHPTLRHFLKTVGFYDIFLIDAETGHILYTVFKEVDLGTNLLTGPYRHTNLARVFREAQQVQTPDFVRLVDFAPYDPSYLAPAAFVATPMFRNGQKIAILAVQLPIDRINALMTSNRNWRAEGLGASGETYLVGADYRMRNDARFLLQEPDRYFDLLKRLETDPRLIELMQAHATTILYQHVRTAASEAALHGHSQTRIVKDYRGVPVLSSYTPLAIADVQWVLLAEIDEAEAFAGVEVLRNRVQGLALLVTLVSGLLGYVLARAITRPVSLLTEGTTALGKGNLSKRVPVTSRDELGMLASSFNQMAENLQRAEQELREATARELRIAREIQMGILPADVSRSTHGTGLDMHAVLEPAQLVGGDLFDVVCTSEGRVVVVVGDVSGKGIPAALFMAVTVILLRTAVRQVVRPEAILRHVNDELTVLNPHMMFVTLLCAVFDTDASRVTWASAGHPLPILIPHGQAPTVASGESGLVAGLRPGIEMRGHSVELAPGDTFVLYTDGVTEALDAQGQLLGAKRLLDQLARQPGRTATETAASILEAIQRHVAGAPQSDDIAVIAVRSLATRNRSHATARAAEGTTGRGESG
jgi:serine phosphatase RsbU (regulator of sigma subunit)